MIAYGTYIGSLGSNNDVTAVAAFPYLDSALFIYVLFDSVRIILPQESRPCILQPESGFSDMDQADR